MIFSRRRVNRALLVVAACMAFSPGAAIAQDKWPSRPIRMIVPVAAGGSLDVVARIVAQHLGEALGTTVVVDNRGGANGTIGNNLVANAAPDGYTMLASTGQFTGSAVLYKKLPYDPVKDFAPVTQIARSYGLVLAINTDVPAQNLQEFIALAKKHPDSMNFGSAGEGNITHLAGALFNNLAGTTIQHVPYKGSGPAFQDVVSKQITMTFVSTSGGLGAIKAGKVRPLAISSPTRAPVIPDVPTFEELGLPGMNKINGWYGLWYPAGTPQAIIDRVQAAVAGFLATPAVKAQFEELGLIAMGTTPAEFSKFLVQDLADQGELVKIANVEPQ
ncbi:tripartite tricarboxylate transporter substrate binding protein [Aquabacter sp. CN5-332]|uniref:Bug family tripartite tricarboxylate transporter substrate binding protein n=1 Tax=Aquabacter sp. CN5-332 TaxID=3156608 RepID=UPI0032B3B90D